MFVRGEFLVLDFEIRNPHQDFGGEDGKKVTATRSGEKSDSHQIAGEKGDSHQIGRIQIT